MVNFYIVRHGQTLLNSLDRAQGWTDSPLTDTGKQTAIELGQQLKGIDFDVVYTSDMLRAVQTAELIRKQNVNPSIPIVVDARLREWCLGDMEAEKNSVFTRNISDWLGNVDSFMELNMRLPDVADEIYRHDTTGMAEPFSIIESRLKAIFLDVAQKSKIHKSSNVLIVTHAFAIKTIFHLFEPELLNTIGKVKNAAVSKLIFDNGVFFFEPAKLL